MLNMVDEVTEAKLAKMIEMGDRDEKGYVDRKDFERLVEELGLIPKEDPEPDGANDYERAFQDAQRQLQKEGGSDSARSRRP